MQNEEFRKLLQAYPAKAIRLLYEKYYHGLVRLAMRHVYDEKIAEDIVQETFVYLWENHRKIGEYNPRPIQYLLMRVVKNKAVSEFRRIGQNELVRTQYAAEVETNTVAADSNIIRRERIELIRKVIDSFPPRERECLTMKMDEELSNEQIAVALCVSKKAVERSITSGNNRLRKWWSENS